MRPEVILLEEQPMKSVLTVLLALASLAMAGCAAQAPHADWAATPSAGPVPKVRLVYAHRTFRCVSCLMIEKMARETVQGDFATQLSNGTMQWQTVDFWQDKQFTDRYGVTLPTVVVITYADGREKSFQRLDELWGLKMDGERFRTVLKDAVGKALQGA
jgi:hypothetical protein